MDRYLQDYLDGIRDGKKEYAEEIKNLRLEIEVLRLFLNPTQLEQVSMELLRQEEIKRHVKKRVKELLNVS